MPKILKRVGVFLINLVFKMKFKNIFVATMFVMISVASVNAQMVVSGNFGFERQGRTQKAGTNTVENSTFSFEFAPSLTYFLSEKFAIGGQIGYALDGKSTNVPIDTTITSGFVTIEPYARYYVTELGKFRIFAQAGLELGFGENVSTVNFGLKPGIQYIINEKWSVETSLNNLLAFTSQTRTSGKGDNKVTMTDSNFGLFLNNPRYAGSNPYELNAGSFSFSINYHF